MLCAVRGAITVEENQSSMIQTAVAELIEAMLTHNQLGTTDLVNVFFTMTPDLTALNPAKAVRLSRTDWTGVPMLCAQEPVVAGMLPRCIRVLMQYHAATDHPAPRAVYLGEAKGLRPDLAGE